MRRQVDEVVKNEKCCRPVSRVRSKSEVKKKSLPEKSQRQLLKEEYAQEQARLRSETKRLAAIDKEVRLGARPPIHHDNAVDDSII